MNLGPPQGRLIQWPKQNMGKKSCGGGEIPSTKILWNSVSTKQEQ